MKKLLFIVVGMLIFSSYVAIGVKEQAGSDVKTIKLQFFKPHFEKHGSFVTVTVEGANAYHYHPGEPILPVFSSTMSFPFGTQIVDFACSTEEVTHFDLSDIITPAPQPVVAGSQVKTPEIELDENIYSSNGLFPDAWCSYSTGGGLDEQNERKTFCTLKVYPVRYNPVKNSISYVNAVEVRISVDVPEGSPFPETSEYDLVIITPSEFSDELQRLVTHKNSVGINTILKTTEDIYNEYSGIDKPEQIKYFIKDAIETWDIKYVLLVGGLNSLIWATPKDDINQGSKDWYLPVRYTNHIDRPETPGGVVYDPGFISDLYFADIYDGGGGFSSWDTNGDGVFAKWKEASSSDKDVLDLYPDVCVGRLPCRNSYEVQVMVDKIITYESGSPAPSWYNKMVVIAGDTHDDSSDRNYIEGELTCEVILERYMTEFTPVKLFASNRDINPEYTPQTTNIKREISAGCGHLLFDGHANPVRWTTHWPGEFDSRIENGGITIYHFPGLSNGDKLPICVIGGCHTNQFNVTLLSTFLDGKNTKHMWTYGYPAPECFSWYLTRKKDGGAIAALGNTGLGIGWVGGEDDINGDGVAEPVTLEGLSPYQQLMFYKTCAEETNILGEAWKGAQKKYLDTGMDSHGDIKTIEQWALLGDPSLKMGGYP